MENQTTRPQTVFSVMDRERLWKWHENLGKGCLIGLIGFLPFAHINFIISPLIGGLVLCVLIRWWLDGKISFPKNPINKPLLFFSAWVIFTLPTATFFTNSLFEVKNELFTQLLIFYSVLFFIKDTRDIKQLLPFLFFALLVLCLFGVFEFWQRDGNILKRSVRIGSLTSDYIYFSTYLILATPMVFLGILVGKKGPLRWGMVFLLIISLICMFLTYTRIAWAGLFAQFLLYGYLRNKKFLYLVIIGIMLFGFFAVFSKSGENLFKTFIQVTPNDPKKIGGVDRRVKAWKFAVEEIKKHPITGIGYGRDTVYFAFDGNEVIDDEWWHTFNTFINTMLEIGVPGLLLFLWLLISLWILLWKEAKSSDHFDSLFATVLLMVFVGFFVRNQFDHLYVDFPAQLFWLLMGLGVKIKMLQKPLL
jgi:O-antigen ligase